MIKAVFKAVRLLFFASLLAGAFENAFEVAKNIEEGIDWLHRDMEF